MSLLTMLRFFYRTFLALAIALCFTSCGGYKQMATRWHYRHDFRLPKPQPQLVKAAPESRITTATLADTVSNSALVSIPAQATEVVPTAVSEPAIPAPSIAPTPAPVTANTNTLTAATSSTIDPKVSDAVRYLATATDEQIVAVAKTQDSGTNGLAIAGFICGLVGLLVIGIVLGIVGLILSILGLNKGTLQGPAIAGIVLSILAILGWLTYQR